MYFGEETDWKGNDPDVRNNVERWSRIEKRCCVDAMSWNRICDIRLFFNRYALSKSGNLTNYQERDKEIECANT